MTYALVSFLSLYALWVFYLAVMNLKRARDAGRLTRTAYVLGAPVLYIGWTLDILVNWLVMSVVLFEFPKETTVTARLKRHIYSSTGWRESVAAWFCSNLLNSFDPDGKHC